MHTAPPFSVSGLREPLIHSDMVRTVFMGSDRFSLPVLDGLVTAGGNLLEAAEVVAVVTQPHRPAGRGRRLQANAVASYAREREIAVLQPERLRDAAALEAFRATQPELVVVASYGQILPRAVLDEPSRGCLNLHPSLLPRYRGPSPIVGPILAGDTSTGTTVMVMVPRMDAGPIVAQEETPITPHETAGELEARLALLSANLLLRVLPDWLAGNCRPTEQDDGGATYTSRTSKMDGLIDWSQSAESIERLVRAYNPWPVAFTTWKGDAVRIHRAQAREGRAHAGSVVELSPQGLVVGTGQGVLVVSQIQLPGGRPLPATDVVRGRPELLSARFAEVE